MSILLYIMFLLYPCVAGMMVLTILIYILLNLYASLLGLKEAIHWSGKSSNAVKWDQHYLFIAERGVVFVSILLASFMHWQDVLVTLVAWALSFSFFHNGSLYLGRKHIDGAYNSWFDSPEGKWNISAGTRSIMFGLSLILIIGHELFY